MWDKFGTYDIKIGENLLDIDIKIFTVSHKEKIACIAFEGESSIWTILQSASSPAICPTSLLLLDDLGGLEDGEDGLLAALEAGDALPPRRGEVRQVLHQRLPLRPLGLGREERRGGDGGDLGLGEGDVLGEDDLSKAVDES